jgi:hypothetical protein
MKKRDGSLILRSEAAVEVLFVLLCWRYLAFVILLSELIINSCIFMCQQVSNFDMIRKDDWM